MNSQLNHLTPSTNAIFPVNGLIDSRLSFGVSLFNKMEEEIWKDVVGYEGIYMVNNLSVVKSIDHLIKAFGGGLCIKKGRVLKTQISKKGYIQVSLSKDVKKFNTGVHRISAIAFIPNPENKPQVNHKNGIKSDNRIENLEWCTNKENQIHAVSNGLCHPNYGENHHRSKLTNLQVHEIRERLKNGETQTNIASYYNVTNTTIYYIKKGIMHTKT